MPKSLLLLLILPLLLCQCAGKNARTLATEEAVPLGFTEVIHDTPFFSLFSLLRRGEIGKPLHVYIEGDGHSFLSATRVSPDPTPRYPVALRLALGDHTGAHVLYLARPGQYLDNTAFPCPEIFWTEERFGEEVLSACMLVIDRALHLFGAKGTVLVGFSGGGTLAALLAARRTDVRFFASCAGNLNLGRWVQEHDLTPFDPSRDPMNVCGKLVSLPQRHLLGAHDTVISHRGTLEFCKAVGEKALFLQVPGLGHTGPWQRYWSYDYETPSPYTFSWSRKADAS
ncbi:MAG: hypothetical protein K5657_03625 [Desulfovibrio sp.]|nr:hypothetical protein [Desulfovibrio sp.]